MNMKIGDIVVSTFGGRTMKIIGISSSGRVWCEWKTALDDQMEDESFPMNLLVPTTPEREVIQKMREHLDQIEGKDVTASTTVTSDNTSRTSEVEPKEPTIPMSVLRAVVQAYEDKIVCMDKEHEVLGTQYTSIREDRDRRIYANDAANKTIHNAYETTTDVATKGILYAHLKNKDNK